MQYEPELCASFYGNFKIGQVLMSTWLPIIQMYSWACSMRFSALLKATIM